MIPTSLRRTEQNGRGVELLPTLKMKRGADGDEGQGNNKDKSSIKDLIHYIQHCLVYSGFALCSSAEVTQLLQDLKSSQR
jgi:hypothetical protein